MLRSEKVKLLDVGVAGFVLLLRPFDDEVVVDRRYGGAADTPVAVLQGILFPVIAVGVGGRRLRRPACGIWNLRLLPVLGRIVFLVTAFRRWGRRVRQVVR